MSGDWKPGDVVTYGGHPVLRTRDGWAYSDGSIGGLHQDAFDPAEPEPTVSPAEARAMRTALARLDREEGRR